jgi:hypothetical protein
LIPLNEFEAKKIMSVATTRNPNFMSRSRWAERGTNQNGAGKKGMRNHHEYWLLTTWYTRRCVVRGTKRWVVDSRTSIAFPAECTSAAEREACGVAVRTLVVEKEAWNGLLSANEYRSCTPLQDDAIAAKSSQSTQNFLAHTRPKTRTQTLAIGRTVQGFTV